MIKNKLYWYGNMAGVVAAWAFIIFGMFMTFDSSMVNTVWWITVLAICVGHPLELAFSIPIGDNAGIERKTTIIKTIIYGFTWWLPLKHGVIDK